MGLLRKRVVLSAEAILLIMLCMGYAFSGALFPSSVALVITAGCYIVDNSLNAVEMARSTYVKKISDNPDEVIVVSMSIPILGGVIWATIGYQAVFVCASGIGRHKPHPVHAHPRTRQWCRAQWRCWAIRCMNSLKKADISVAPSTVTMPGCVPNRRGFPSS